MTIFTASTGMIVVDPVLTANIQKTLSSVTIVKTVQTVTTSGTSAGAGVPGTESSEVLLVMITREELEKSFYTFVYDSFYHRHVSCDVMLKQFKSLYRNRVNSDDCTEAVRLYKSFSDKEINFDTSSEA